MITIDLDKVYPNANTLLGLTPRWVVEQILEWDDVVSHIESTSYVGGRKYVTVEMGTGYIITVPADALVRR